MNSADSPHSAIPEAEWLIDESLVRRLLQDQHPDLAELPLRSVGQGWDNAIFRLGNDLAVRLPRRAAAADLILQEQKWLPLLSQQVSLPVPTPCRRGNPTADYPWKWSVVAWLPGEPSSQSEPAVTEAPVFARFLRSLHVTAPPDAPVNPFRDVPLIQRDGSMSARMERIGQRTGSISEELRQTWKRAVAARLDVAPTWLHGDLHPGNVLVDRGRITGIIDWGDLCSGDRATDLASAWTLFDDASARREFWIAYGAVSDETVCRAKGWAFLFGLVLFDTGLQNHPRNAPMGPSDPASAFGRELIRMLGNRR